MEGGSSSVRTVVRCSSVGGIATVLRIGCCGAGAEACVSGVRFVGHGCDVCGTIRRGRSTASPNEMMACVTTAISVHVTEGRGGRMVPRFLTKTRKSPGGVTDRGPWLSRTLVRDSPRGTVDVRRQAGRLGVLSPSPGRKRTAKRRWHGATK